MCRDSSAVTPVIDSVPSGSVPSTPSAVSPSGANLASPGVYVNGSMDVNSPIDRLDNLISSNTSDRRRTPSSRERTPPSAISPTLLGRLSAITQHPLISTYFIDCWGAMDLHVHSFCNSAYDWRIVVGIEFIYLLNLVSSNILRYNISRFQFSRCHKISLLLVKTAYDYLDVCRLYCHLPR